MDEPVESGLYTWCLRHCAGSRMTITFFDAKYGTIGEIMCNRDVFLVLDVKRPFDNSSLRPCAWLDVLHRGALGITNVYIDCLVRVGHP
jgi:hypothetical protein